MAHLPTITHDRSITFTLYSYHLHRPPTTYILPRYRDLIIQAYVANNNPTFFHLAFK